MRYWALLAGKLIVVALVAGGSLWVLNEGWDPIPPLFHLNFRYFAFDLLYTTTIGIWFLFVSGLMTLCIIDQRYRCRVCARRLRMPVETGSWSLPLQFGRPQMEYICAYGHGRLNVAEVQISGIENPEWKEQGDFWDELYATHDRDKES